MGGDVREGQTRKTITIGRRKEKCTPRKQWLSCIYSAGIYVRNLRIQRRGFLVQRERYVRHRYICRAVHVVGFFFVCFLCCWLSRGAEGAQTCSIIVCVMACMLSRVVNACLPYLCMWKQHCLLHEHQMRYSQLIIML